ncbi:HVA22-like protein k [Populus alba x Populus x berolinensis]|nr:HVA22-like protein k [Populus alba x Populus x berolinensis]
MDKKCHKPYFLVKHSVSHLKKLSASIPMALLGSNVVNEVGLRLLLCPLGSNIVVRTACCSVGIVLPVYHTFKAIERKDENEEQKWLMYWAAYGSFTLAEVFTDKLISWFPMYYHMKFAFLVWLQLPSAEGAKQLYMNHLRPFLLRHQARVDLIMGLAYGEMVKLISNHQAELQYAKRMLLKVMGSADQMLKDAPNHPEGHPEVPAIEEEQTRTILDAESDHAD